MSNPKVLFIAGMGRSGSTLLDTMLGEVEGFCTGGELNLYWESVDEEGWKVAEGWRCGCGKELGECEVWSEVARRLGEQRPSLPVGELREIYDSLIRTQPRQLARLLTARVNSSTSERLNLYAESMSRLYRTLASVTGARVIVDSSKLPQGAWVAATRTDLDLRVVHLVRDPRGVAFSFRRKKREPGRTGGFPQVDPFRIGVAWALRNAFIETQLRRRLGERFMRLRYEELVSEPEAAARALAALAEEPYRGLRFADRHTVVLGENHTVSGNPRRFGRGDTPIRADEEWKERMGGGQRLAALLPALPLMRRYGYPLRARP